MRCRCESIATCARSDGTGSSPTFVFDVYAAAIRRLIMRKAPSRGGVPAEMMATRGPAADAKVHELCFRHIFGEEGHAHRIQG